MFKMFKLFEMLLHPLSYYGSDFAISLMGNLQYMKKFMLDEW